MNFLTKVMLGLALLPTPLAAATVANDAYELTVSLDGDSQTSDQTAVIGEVVTGAVGGLNGFELSWVDGDTFFVSGISTSSITDLLFVLTGLDFLEGGNPASIVNVVFDPVATMLSSFVGFTSIVGPVVAFEDGAIAVVLSFIPDAAPAEQFFIDEGIAFEGQLVNVAADGVRFHFDVTARPAVDPIAPVPLPASALMLAGALAGLAGLRRNRKAS